MRHKEFNTLTILEILSNHLSNCLPNKHIMTDEYMRGVRFNIHDVILHADAIHKRGA